MTKKHLAGQGFYSRDYEKNELVKEIVMCPSVCLISPPRLSHCQIIFKPKICIQFIYWCTLFCIA